MSLIEVRHVTKIYQLGDTQVKALAGVSLTIERGEYISLVGASGSGKSTLMNTLGCLDRPTGGSYRLDGIEVSEMTADQRARLRNARIGFVFQNFNLLNRTSAIENVELPLLYNREINHRERTERAKSLLARVGLADRMDHHPGQLSGGQQQRVAIARALVNHPSILMADEPTGNLDSRTSGEIMQLFQQLNEQQHITIILVTHDRDVAGYAHRIVTLRDGLIIGDSQCPDAVAELTQSEATEPSGN
jgi:ABC-type lipoprotein export system ATPase subunit